MKEKDKKEFAECMAGLAEAFSQSITKEKVKIYYEYLKDLEIQDIQEACSRLIQTRTYSTFPQVAEIREAVLGEVNTRAIMALAKVEEAIKKYSGYESLVFDDPYIHAVIELLGGWEKVYWMDDEEWKWAKKDFERYYIAFLRTVTPQNMINQAPKRLIGRNERVNTTNGYEQFLKLKDGDKEIQVKTYEINYIGSVKKILDWTGLKAIGEGEKL